MQATVSKNERLNGIEVRFPNRPEQSELTWLRSNGFRWGGRTKVWYKRFDQASYDKTLAYFGGKEVVSEKQTVTPNGFQLEKGTKIYRNSSYLGYIQKHITEAKVWNYDIDMNFGPKGDSITAAEMSNQIDEWNRGKHNYSSTALTYQGDGDFRLYYMGNWYYKFKVDGITDKAPDLSLKDYNFYTPIENSAQFIKDIDYTFENKDEKMKAQGFGLKDLYEVGDRVLFLLYGQIRPGTIIADKSYEYGVTTTSYGSTVVKTTERNKTWQYSIQSDNGFMDDDAKPDVMRPLTVATVKLPTVIPDIVTIKISTYTSNPNGYAHPFNVWDALTKSIKSYQHTKNKADRAKKKVNINEWNAAAAKHKANLQQYMTDWYWWEVKYPEFARQITGESEAEQKGRWQYWAKMVKPESETTLTTNPPEINIPKGIIPESTIVQAPIAQIEEPINEGVNEGINEGVNEGANKQPSFSQKILEQAAKNPKPVPENVKTTFPDIKNHGNLKGFLSSQGLYLLLDEEEKLHEAIDKNFDRKQLPPESMFMPKKKGDLIDKMLQTSIRLEGQKVKEPWLMIASAYATYKFISEALAESQMLSMALGIPEEPYKTQWKKSVQEAIFAEKPVPIEVLTDYRRIFGEDPNALEPEPDKFPKRMKTNPELIGFLREILKLIKNGEAVLFASTDWAIAFNLPHINSLKNTDHMGFGFIRAKTATGYADFEAGNNMRQLPNYDYKYTMLTGDKDNVVMASGKIGYPYAETIKKLEDIIADFDSDEPASQPARTLSEVETPGSEVETLAELKTWYVIVKGKGPFDESNDFEVQATTHEEAWKEAKKQTKKEIVQVRLAAPNAQKPVTSIQQPATLSQKEKEAEALILIMQMEKEQRERKKKIGQMCDGGPLDEPRIFNIEVADPLTGDIKQLSNKPLTIAEAQAVQRSYCRSHIIKHNLAIDFPMETGGQVNTLAVAEEIYRQIGRKAFVMMGAYNWVGDANSLRFRIKGSPNINYIKITLNSMDTYDIEFGKIYGNTYKVIDTANGIYNDRLNKTIEEHTGLYLKLFAGGGTLPEDVVAVISQATITGNTVMLNAPQLDRKLYTQVAKALEGIGGKWNRKAQGFVFSHDPTELLADIAGGTKRNLKKEFQFFATPPQLADQLVGLYADPIEDHYKILEPSAGQGAIVKAILHYHKFIKQIDCCELMPQNRAELEKIPGLKIIADDFLTLGPEYNNYYDRVIANPPFTKNQDIDHIYKMYQVCKPGGRIVSLASKHWQLSSNRKETEFRNWLDQHEVKTFEVEMGTFKESGTNIPTVLLVIFKEKDDTMPVVEPVETTVTAVEPSEENEFEFVNVDDIDVQVSFNRFGKIENAINNTVQEFNNNYQEQAYIQRQREIVHEKEIQALQKMLSEISSNRGKEWQEKKTAINQLIGKDHTAISKLQVEIHDEWENYIADLYTYINEQVVKAGINMDDLEYEQEIADEVFREITERPGTERTWEWTVQKAIDETIKYFANKPGAEPVEDRSVSAVEPPDTNIITQKLLAFQILLKNTTDPATKQKIKEKIAAFKVLQSLAKQNRMVSEVEPPDHIPDTGKMINESEKLNKILNEVKDIAEKYFFTEYDTKHHVLPNNEILVTALICDEPQIIEYDKYIHSFGAPVKKSLSREELKRRLKEDLEKYKDYIVIEGESKEQFADAEEYDEEQFYESFNIIWPKIAQNYIVKLIDHQFLAVEPKTMQQGGEVKVDAQPGAIVITKCTANPNSENKCKINHGKTYEFEGKQQSATQILSKLNQDAGGKSLMHPSDECVEGCNLKGIGEYHTNDGIKTDILGLDKTVEVEKDELILVPEISSLGQYNFEGKQQTGKEIVSFLNQDGGGIPIHKDGGILDPDTSIQAKDTVSLIMEAARKGYRKVKVVFIPAYEEELHKNLTNKELIENLKKSKVETFDIIEESDDILKLLKSKDVISINYTK